MGGDVEESNDEDDIVCFVCLSGDVSEGNDILICEGEHEKNHGCHQSVVNPPWNVFLMAHGTV